MEQGSLGNQGSRVFEIAVIERATPTVVLRTQAAQLV